MRVTKLSDGFIAPLEHGELDQADLVEIDSMSRNPFHFIEQIEEYEQVLHALMQDQRELADTSDNDRDRELASLATYAWVAAGTVLHSWENEDIETAIRLACQLGWCLAKIEDFQLEADVQARHRSLSGSKKGALVRQNDLSRSLAPIRDFMLAQLRESPKKQYKSLVLEACAKFHIRSWRIERHIHLYELVDLLNKESAGEQIY